MSQIEAKAKADLARVVNDVAKDDNNKINPNSNNNNNSEIEAPVNKSKASLLTTEMAAKIRSEFGNRSGTPSSMSGSTVSFASVVNQVVLNKNKNGRRANRRRTKSKKGVLKLKEAAQKLSRESSFVKAANQSK